MTSPATRDQLVADRSIGGVAFCRALSDVTDTWLGELFDAAVARHRPKKAVALVAVGGYGRRELAPFSDLDVMLVHDGQKNVQDLASDIWYPIWDAGAKLGHSVCTIAQALDLAKSDLDTATTILSARVIAGDHGLVDSFARQARDAWRKAAEARLAHVQESVANRHAAAGEVAFLLEPNLKEGEGGLRDIHAMTWTQAAGVRLDDADLVSLEECNRVLLDARVALHRVSGRANDVLRLEDQDAVAEMVGAVDADALMADVASAARTVAWITGEVWGRVRAERFAQQADELVAPGVVIRRGDIHLDESADPATDRTLVLRVATAAARHRARIDRVSLDRLAEYTPVFSDPWPAGASDDLVALLLTGHAAIPVWESLDQRGLVTRVLPEWEPVRSRPQRNAYHRFTVDRHLWEAAANAAELATQVSRPDLLVLGALLHDIGKGYPGDHTDAGIELVRVIGPRLGLSADDVAIIELLVRHHLLLPDVATRRDLSDPVTITAVADAVGSTTVLELLATLTEADSRATGPSAWSPWKAGLMDELVDRTRVALGGAEPATVWHLFPSESDVALMATGELHIRTEPDRVVVVSPDVPGTFSRVAGVLSLHGLAVLGAQAHSDEQGMAVSEFLVDRPSYGDIEWDPVVESLRRALDGQLAIEARLADRARTYRRKRRQSANTAGPPSVMIDNDAATLTTLIEVRAPDKIGVLHLITKALAELRLDIRHARVLTIDQEVVDTFYVRTSSGMKLVDDFHRAEVERALLHALGSSV